MPTKNPAPKPFNPPPFNGIGRPQAKTPPKILLPPKDCPEPMVDESGRPITVENAKDWHCRGVHGEVGTPEFRYCGHTVLPGYSFCAYHAGRFFDKSYTYRRDVA